MTSVEDATQTDLLEATILYYGQYHPDSKRWLQLGYAIAQPDGHRHVAQAWYDAACDFWEMQSKARKKVFGE